MTTTRITAALGLAVAVVAGAAARWTPAEWGALSTLEIRTRCPAEGDHWSRVWLVVLDGQVYVRLGTRAAGRIACSQTRPYLGVRVGDAGFEHVRGVEAPAQAAHVAQAMAAKYWSDVIVRHFAHPLTLRLVPE